MALPPPGERKPRPPKGKTKQRKYAVTYCKYTDDSTDEGNHRVMEIKSTSVQSAHTSLIKKLKEATNRTDIRKSDVVLVEAVLVPPRMSFNEFMGFNETEDEE